MLIGAISVRLPPVAETPGQRLSTELVADLMRQVARTLRDTSKRIVMRGGTAAKIGHGLPRPSSDIDIDVVGDLDPWSTLQEAADQSGLIALTEPQRRRALKGALLLTDPRSGAVRVEVDMRRIRETVDEAAILAGSLAEYRNGVFMYAAPTLVRQKFEMTHLPAHRLRAKDRYDIAWWLTEHTEHVPPALRIALDRALRASPALREGWDENHRGDDILRVIEPDTVHTVLTNALDHDPAVLQDRWPEGSLTLHIDEGPATRLTWSCGNDIRDETFVASFDNDQGLERFMRAFGLWQPDDVPELLKEITLERQRAIEATMSRQR